MELYVLAKYIDEGKQNKAQKILPKN